MRGNDTGRTVLYLRVDVEDGDLSLGPPLLLVEVGHHVLDPGYGLLQQLYIPVLARPPKYLKLKLKKT